jgi:hypothetical protein
MTKIQLYEKEAVRSEKRLRRERHTLRVMIEMHCQQQHHSYQLCDDCQRLLDYAMLRIDKCPFKADKPTCAKCPVHCYKPEMREQIRQVMRFSGPKIIFIHPILATMHIWDGNETLKSKKGW